MGFTISKGENEPCCFCGHVVGIYRVPLKVHVELKDEGPKVLPGDLLRRNKLKREAYFFLLTFILILKQDSTVEMLIMCNA